MQKKEKLRLEIQLKNKNKATQPILTGPDKQIY